MAPDIADEQAKLTRADTVIFQFPLNWATVPAILKGYFDRVLTLNFAFGGRDIFDRGKLKVGLYSYCKEINIQKQISI